MHIPAQEDAEHYRTPVQIQLQGKIIAKRSERVPGGGRRRAGTATYK